jgi:AraC-like DNA-binding protein
MNQREELPKASEFRLSNAQTGITVENGGLFTSRGRGKHPERVLESFELIMVRSGKLKLREEERRFTLGPGEAMLLWPGRQHQGIGRLPAGLQFYWVHFRCDTPAHEPDGHTELQVPQTVKLTRPDRMEELFRRFLDDQEAGNADSLQTSAYLILMLAEMRPTQDADEADKKISRMASRADAFIQANFHKPIYPASIANKFNLNVDYIGRIYKQSFRITLTEAIRRRRLKQAREHLLHSDANMNEIAHDCGFGTSTYFRRSFKQSEGISPTRWRALHSSYRTNTQ